MVYGDYNIKISPFAGQIIPALYTIGAFLQLDSHNFIGSSSFLWLPEL
jgi:hypothetical protein